MQFSRWLCTTAIAIATPLSVLSTTTQALPLRSESNIFDDTATHWAAFCLEGAGNSGLMKGYPSGVFLPDGSMTRAEFAAVIVKAFPDAPRIRAAPQFSDVASNFWGRAAIIAAYEKGFLAGYPNNRFQPNQPITRVQALTIIANAVNPPRSENSNGLNSVLTATDVEAQLRLYLDDAAAIPAYAKVAIAIAAQQSLMVNYPEVRQLRPHDNITRGEATAILCRRSADRTDARYYVPAKYVARAQQPGVDPDKSLSTLGDEHVIQVFENNTGIAGLLHTTATLGDRLFFFFEDGVQAGNQTWSPDGSQIWSSDGTAAGTQQLRALNTSDETPGDQHPKVIANSDQSFWLVASRSWPNSPGLDKTLWSSDGAASGTQPLEQLHPDLTTAFPIASNLNIGTQLFRGRLPFVLNQQSDQAELWLSDGATLAGTERLLTLGKWGRIEANTLTPASNSLFFQATVDDPSNPNQRSAYLWHSDGTSGGTQPLRKMVIQEMGSVSNAANSGKSARVYISTPPITDFEQGNTPAALWTSDGTVEGTQRLKSIQSHSELQTGAASPRLLTQLGDRFLGLANTSDGFELWASQGTPETTVRVKRLSDRMNNWERSQPFQTSTSQDPVFQVYKNQLFFSIPIDRDDEKGQVRRSNELWVTDGSETGTQPLAAKPVVLGMASGVSAEGFTVYRDRLFFSWLGANGRELWETDGTPAGTRQVIDLISGYYLRRPLPCSSSDSEGACQPQPIQQGSYPRSLTVLGDWLYFIADDGDIFRTDGTVKNTQHVYRFDGWPYRTFPPNMVRLGDRLLIMGYENELKLWALPR